MPHTILITGASSGIGALSARALALAGHTVYADLLSPQRMSPLQEASHG